MICIFLILCMVQPIMSKSYGKCTKCGPSEVDTSKDKCLCEWELSCNAPMPGGCTPNCATRKCSCKPGLYRNLINKCVPWKECPKFKKEANPCAGIICSDGMCENIETECGNPPCPVRPECKSPPRPKSDCTNHPCGCDRCVMVSEIGCDGPNCPSVPDCIPKDALYCADTDCGDVNVCVMTQVQCFTAPCYPIPRCVPI